MGLSSSVPLLHPSLPLKDSFASNSTENTKFYAFEILHSMKSDDFTSQYELVLRVSVLSGSLRGVYCARDERLPSLRRPLWIANHFCKCKSNKCDNCWPNCRNSEGGVCALCVSHDAEFSHVSHVTALSGTANSDDAAKSKASQTSAHFAIRIPLKNSEVTEGKYFVTVEKSEFSKEKGNRRKGFTTVPPVKMDGPMGGENGVAVNSPAQTMPTEVFPECSFVVSLESRCVASSDPKKGNGDFLKLNEERKEEEEELFL